MIDTKNDDTAKARSTDICECGDQRSFHVDRLGCGVSGCGCTKFVLKKDETATAQPTDEAFVKQYYPDAELVGWIDGACAIFSQRRGLASSTGYIGWSQEKSNVSSTRAHKQAWRDARERIEALMPVAPSEPAPTIAESAAEAYERGFYDGIAAAIQTAGRYQLLSDKTKLMIALLDNPEYEAPHEL